MQEIDNTYTAVDSRYKKRNQKGESVPVKDVADEYGHKAEAYIKIFDGGSINLEIQPYTGMRWIIDGEIGNRKIDKEEQESRQQVLSFLDQYLKS